MVRTSPHVLIRSGGPAALFDITAAAHRQINFFSQNVLHKEHFVFNKET